MEQLAEIQFFCVLSPKERYVAWARDAGEARSLCLQDTGRDAGLVLTGDPQTAGGMAPLASQKRVFGPFHLVTLVFSAWYLILQPLTGFSLALALEPLALLKGQIDGGLVFASFQALYALSIVAMLLLTGRNERYTNRTHLGALNGLVTAGLCGLLIAFAEFDGSSVISRGGLAALGTGVFVLLSFLTVQAMATGRLPGSGTAAPMAGLVRRLRASPYSVELLSLAGIPALWLNAEISRVLLQVPLRMMRYDLAAGRLGPELLRGLLYLLIMGTLVYALLVYPSRTIGIQTMEHGRLHRVVQKKPPALRSFVLSCLGFLAALAANAIFRVFLSP